MLEMMGYVANSSKLKPLPSSELGIILAALRASSKNADWYQLTSCNLKQLEIKQILEAFFTLERILQQSDHSDAERIAASSSLRKWIKRFGMAANVARADRLSTLFRTSFPVPRRNRKMISDFAECKMPIGALAHGSSAELKVLTSQRIDQTLLGIRHACLSELDQVDESSEKFDRLFVGRCNQVFVLRLLSIVAKGNVTWQMGVDPRLIEADPVELIAGFYALMSDPSYWPCT
ncbi:MAG: hypothetical protein Q8R59_16625, partial [Polaromonas sp.]|nr:hypothetical protein [Polaromonas sp.]